MEEHNNNLSIEYNKWKKEFNEITDEWINSTSTIADYKFYNRLVEHINKLSIIIRNHIELDWLNAPLTEEEKAATNLEGKQVIEW